MKTNYTPTPWHITTNPHDAGDGSFYIVDQNINPSVCLRLDTQDSEQDRANAEFIVRAVNNHRALAAFVASVRDDMRHMMEHDKLPNDCCPADIYTIAEEILASL